MAGTLVIGIKPLEWYISVWFADGTNFYLLESTEMELEIVKKTPVRLLEKLYAVLMLFLMTRPLWQFMIVGGVDIQFLAVAGLYIVPLRFALNRPGHFAWVGSRDKLLLFLVFLVLVSVVWSTDPSSAAKAGLTLLGGAFFGIYLAMRFSLREQMQVMAWTLGIIAILSLIVIVASPALGTQTAAGKTVWVGLYEHKNGLGRFMTINAVLTWIMMKDSRRKWLSWGIIILSVIMVLMTRSATSLVALIATLCLLPVYRVWRWRNARALPGYILLGLLTGSIAIVFLTNLQYAGLDWFFDALGRNLSRNTLQIRLALWDVVLEKAQERPWLGFGYGNTSIYDSLDEIALVGSAWSPEQAHNGFLEIFLQLGLIGLAGMVCHVILGFRRGITLARLTKTNESLWVLAYLTVLLLFNLTYSVYLGQLTMPWSIYVALSLSVCFQLAGKKPVLVSPTGDESIPA